MQLYQAPSFYAHVLNGILLAVALVLLDRHASILSRMGIVDRVGPVALGERGRSRAVSLRTGTLGYSPLS